LTLAKAVERPVDSALDIRIVKEMLRNIGKEPVHRLGFHGPLKQFKAMSLKYENENYNLLYFGFIPQ